MDIKKLAPVIAAATALAAFSASPAAAAADIDLGVKVGLSLAQYKWSNQDEAMGYVLNPAFGGFVGFSLSKVFAVQVEASLLTQGGRNRGEPLSYRAELMYLHFPILARARLAPGEKLVPVVFAGPAVNLRLSAHAKYYTDGDLTLDDNIADAIHSTNLDFVFGVGVEYNVTNFRVLLDVRYLLGLADVERYSAALMKTRALLFSAGFGF